MLADGYTRIDAQGFDRERAIFHKLSRDVYRAIGAQGFARIDFLMSGERIVVSEINTIPGFTPISLFPTMPAEGGYTFTDVNQFTHTNARRSPPVGTSASTSPSTFSTASRLARSAARTRSTLRHCPRRFPNAADRRSDIAYDGARGLIASGAARVEGRAPRSTA